MDAWRPFVNQLPARQKPPLKRPIKLVCFDMDGVLTRHESSWVAVHERFGTRDGPGFQAFVRGEIDDHEFIRWDVRMWMSKRPQMTLDDVHEVLDAKVGLVDGAVEACRMLRTAGVEIAIVSGGIEHAANRIADLLGIKHVSANGLHCDEQGRLTGEGFVNTPLRAKHQPVERFASELGLDLGQVASVGNSSPDIPMFQRTGLGIAFRGTDPYVRKWADHVVESQNLVDVARVVLDETQSSALSGS